MLRSVGRGDVSAIVALVADDVVGSVGLDSSARSRHTLGIVKLCLLQAVAGRADCRWMKREFDMAIIGEWLRRLGYLLRRGAEEDALRREMEAHRAVMEDPRAFGNTLASAGGGEGCLGVAVARRARARHALGAANAPPQSRLHARIARDAGVRDRREQRHVQPRQRPADQAAVRMPRRSGGGVQPSRGADLKRCGASRTRTTSISATAQPMSLRTWRPRPRSSSAWRLARARIGRWRRP